MVNISKMFQIVSTAIKLEKTVTNSSETEKEFNRHFSSVAKQRRKVDKIKASILQTSEEPKW